MSQQYSRLQNSLPNTVATELQGVPTSSRHLWNPYFKSTKSSIYVFILYSEKIFSNISNCFLTLENSFRFFSTVFISWIVYSWKESKRIFKGQKTFLNIRRYFWRVQYKFSYLIEICVMRLFEWFANTVKAA